MATRQQATGKKIRIRYVKSGIGTEKNRRRTLRALGLKRLNSEVIQTATPEIAGMINVVRHLVDVSEVNE